MRERVSLLKSNRGASLVLVSAFSVIILGIAATLIIIGALLLSKAGSVRKHDQACELATSLSSQLEKMILNPASNGSPSRLDLDKFITAPATSGEVISCSGFDSIPDSTVTAVVEKKDDNGKVFYTLKVTATAAGETYIVTTDYDGSAAGGYSRR
ncbi:MAG: hypothetical protein K6E66_04970 [Lachnospiraceae bacterium]|nr:hypothetical protein [Lachnospiraceae bacterium]